LSLYNVIPNDTWSPKWESQISHFTEFADFICDNYSEVLFMMKIPLQTDIDMVRIGVTVQVFLTAQSTSVTYPYQGQIRALNPVLHSLAVFYFPDVYQH
jgi:hypothetical protein